MVDNSEIMVCRNCELYNHHTNFCSDKNKEFKPDHNCINFKKSTEYSAEIELLKDPNLFDIITIKEFDKKIVKEVDTRQTIFLITCGRLVEIKHECSDNLMVNSNSGAGKDYITEKVFEILPNEEKVEKKRISPKVLSYLKNRINNPTDTWRKIALRLEDIPNNVLNDDSFKVMSSNKGIAKIDIVVQNKIKSIEIEGKPSIVITIASAYPKEEMLRRYPICNLDESIDQTKEIINKHAELAERGAPTEYDPLIIKALSRLKIIKVKVPFANKIAERINKHHVTMRTSFSRFIDYIKFSTALHQYQRETDDEGFYIATPKDYDIARIAIKKTTSNQSMIPLTKEQRNIIDILKKIKDGPKSIQELTSITKEFTERQLRYQLDKLVKYGFIIRSTTKNEGSIKPINVYKYGEFIEIEIPTAEELGLL